MRTLLSFFLLMVLCIVGAEYLISQVSTPGITLQWTAPGDRWYVGDTGLYPVSAYEFRFDTLALDSTDGAWARAVVIPQTISPKPPGNRETFTVKGLTPGRRYFFALRSRDGAVDSLGQPRYNWSRTSNIAARFNGDLAAPTGIYDLK